MLVCCLTGYDGIVVDQYFNFDVNIFVIRVTDLKMFIISLAQLMLESHKSRLNCVFCHFLCLILSTVIHSNVFVIVSIFNYFVNWLVSFNSPYEGDHIMSRKRRVSKNSKNLVYGSSNESSVLTLPVCQLCCAKQALF